MGKKTIIMKKKRRKLKNQLIITFIITLVLPSFVMIGTTRAITRAIMDKKINGLVNDSLVNTTQSTDLLFRNYTTMVGMLSSDYQLINKLHIINETEEGDTITQEVEELREQLYLAAFMYSEIESIILVTNDYGAIPYYKKGVRINSDIYREICDQASQVPITVGGVLPQGAINKDGQSIYIARKIMDLNTLEYLGTIIVCINPQPIYDLLYNKEISSYTTNVIVSSEKQAILSEDQKMIGNYIFKESIEHVGGDGIESHTMDLRYFQWKLVYQVDEKLVMQELYYLENVISFISIIFLILMITNIIFVSNRFTRRIPNLIRAMKGLQTGDFDIEISISTNNEIGEIEKTFNYMVSRIKRLMDQNTNQYKRLIMATKQTKEAEIRALEAQINPHFLYNTLDSINWMAIEKEEHEISYMINNLAQILRYSISNIGNVVTVKNEMDWLTQYLYLQKQRFANIFDYRIYAEPDVYACRMYKLLLQPLIENAITHGFAGYKEGGLLEIKFEKIKDDYIKIQIKDNGVGLDEVSQKRINQLLEQLHLASIVGSIGVANVVSRIKLYYGECGKICVESDNTGTRIILTLPNIKEEEILC